MLGQCFSLTVLDLSRNGIGAQGVGRSAKVLGSAPDSPSCILMSIGLERMPLSCFGLAFETELGFLYGSLARQRPKGSRHGLTASATSPVHMFIDA